MKSSVAGKVALGAMILVVIAVSITSYAAIEQQTAAMEDAENRAADLLSSAIAISSASSIVSHDIANLVQTVKRIKEQNSSLIWIAIYDDDDKKLIEYPEDFDITKSVSGRKMLRPIQAHGQSFGKIEMLFDTTPRENLKRDIMSTTMAVASILLFLALLGSLIWGHYFAKPIVELSSAAERVSQGNLKTKVNIANKDEIGRLAERFNEMVENLDKSRTELERTLNELSALYSVSRIINTTSDRSEILRLNIETLATGFNFSPIVILLQMQHKWIIAAIKNGGIESSPTFPMNVILLSDIGIESVTEKEAPFELDGNKLSKEWGFGEGYSHKVYAVPLRSGSNIVGLLIAGGKAAGTKDAVQILSVVASQIAPPVLISIMVEREMEKLTNPFEYIAARINQILENTNKFGLNLSIISFGFHKDALKGGATQIEKKFQTLEQILKKKIQDAELIVRYGVNKIIVVVPGFSKLDAMKTVMTLDSDYSDELETNIAVAPDNGHSASELLSFLESTVRG